MCSNSLNVPFRFWYTILYFVSFLSDEAHIKFILSNSNIEETILYLGIFKMFSNSYIYLYERLRISYQYWVGFPHMLQVVFCSLE